MHADLQGYVAKILEQSESRACASLNLEDRILSALGYCLSERDRFHAEVTEERIAASSLLGPWPTAALVWLLRCHTFCYLVQNV